MVSAYFSMKSARPVMIRMVGLPSGAYRGKAFRVFDQLTRAWAIWWLDARTPHTLDPPVIGAFADGVGTRECDDTLEGKPIRVRFQRPRKDTASPRWAQAVWQPPSLSGFTCGCPTKANLCRFLRMLPLRGGKATACNRR
jgi:hypothetical protein